MKIIHISDKKIGNKNFVSGIKTVLLEEVKYENKIFGTVSKILLLKKLDEENNTYIFDEDISKKILEFKPNFVIFDGFWVIQHCFIARFLKKQKIRYYIKPHGSFNKIAQKNSKFKFIKKLIARILIFNNYVRNSNGLIFLNEMEKENSIYRKENEIILPNGIEKLKSKIVSKEKKEDINFIFLGRIDIFNKGIDILLETVLNNKEYFFKNKVKFKFYGNGKEKDMKFFNNYLNKIPEIIKYYGVVYGEEKYKVLEENDIFILISRFEGMPMGILEALSVGIPCFISKETGMGEYIKKFNCGEVIENLEEVFLNLRKIIESYKSNKEEYIKNSKKCSEYFFWKNIIKIYENEYEKL